jgi:hypothetical protein
VTVLTTGVLIVLALACAGWAVLYAVRERAFDNAMFYGLAMLEGLLVVQLVAGIVAALASDRDVESATFLGYLLTSVLILPLSVVWAVAEKSRWGMAVVAFGGLTVAALVLRAYQVWAGPGA